MKFLCFWSTPSSWICSFQIGSGSFGLAVVSQICQIGFPYFGCAYLDGLYPHDHDKTVPVFLAYMERLMLSMESYLAGVHLGVLHGNISRIARGGNPVPLADLGGNISRLQSNYLAQKVERMAKELYDKYAESEPGKYLRRFAEVMAFGVPYTYIVSLLPVPGLHPGRGWTSLRGGGPRRGPGAQWWYRAYLNTFYILKFEPEFTRAVVNMATQEPGFLVNKLTDALVREFNGGLAKAGVSVS